MKTGKLQQLVKLFERQSFIVWLRRRHPAFTTFILNRLSLKHFTGLPLTIILFICGINIMLLSQLAEDVVESEGIVAVDENFTQMLYDIRTVWVSEFFYFISYFGTREAVFAVGGVLTVFLLVKKEYIAVVAFWVAMAGTGLSVQYGKKYISRDRPEDVGYYTEKNFSFPSGHATTSMGLYGFCAYLLYRLSRTALTRKFILVIAGILIPAVGFSRIYLGVHYLSDVLAGFLLGLLWVLLGLSVLEWLYYVKRRKEKETT